MDMGSRTKSRHGEQKMRGEHTTLEKSVAWGERKNALGQKGHQVGFQPCMGAPRRGVCRAPGRLWVQEAEPPTDPAV